ncbi:MAG: hypothetical protein K1000chlam4_00459 [Chlamydiae bacterium]|nr:hypothetical protein [Chlamydiota bacterium]
MSSAASLNLVAIRRQGNCFDAAVRSKWVGVAALVSSLVIGGGVLAFGATGLFVSAPPTWLASSIGVVGYNGCLAMFISGATVAGVGGMFGLSVLFAKVSVHTRDHRGETSLHRAVESGDRKRVIHLLSRGANIKAKDCFRGTPLMKSVYHVGILRFFLQHGIDPDGVVFCGQTLLHRAAIGKGGSVKLLLKLMQPEAIKKQDVSGETALHIAVEYGFTKIAKLLLEKMSPEAIRLKNGKGKTAQQLAEKNGHDTLVALFSSRKTKGVKKLLRIS